MRWIPGMSLFEWQYWYECRLLSPGENLIMFVPCARTYQYDLPSTTVLRARSMLRRIMLNMLGSRPRELLSINSRARLTGLNCIHVFEWKEEAHSRVSVTGVSSTQQKALYQVLFALFPEIRTSGLVMNSHSSFRRSSIESIEEVQSMSVFCLCRFLRPNACCIK